MSDIRIVNTTGLANCGGRCLLRCHVQDGRVLKITTETANEARGRVPLTACARGLNCHKTFLGEDRLLTPLRRVGERGEGRFERISWDEALDVIASELTRVKEKYGPGSRFVHYGCGDSGVLNGTTLAKRLLALDGGYLDYYNNYSNPCVSYASRLMYGTANTGNSPEDWLNSRLIVLWGHNPAETRFDAPTMHYLRLARDRGTPIVVIDPRRSDTVDALRAEWIPIRPATDAALADAMAYVIVKNGLEDRAFLDSCCVGFDREHMPEGADPGECILDYLMGARDGLPKTPRWAEGITGVPAKTIEELALRYATAKPAALIQGYGAQRHGNGEQAARGGILLACLTGNVGVPGGWACGGGSTPSDPAPRFPSIKNPYGRAIPVYRWTDALANGRAMTERDGVTSGQLESDIKLIVNLAGNCLVNQHGDINRTAALLRDTSKCEFIVCSDLFMTASARFADILLPGTSMFECENISFPWKYGDFVGYVNKVIEPPGECRQEYDWLRELASRLGCEPAFSKGLDARGWLERIYANLRNRAPELPDMETFRRDAVAYFREKPPVVAFEAQRRDIKNSPFPTPSGRIELYSENAAGLPPIPRYVPAPEGPEDPLRARYPLQLIGWHTKRRAHSVHDNNPALEKLDPQTLRLNPADAAPRGISEGDEVIVFNDRGRLRVPVHITDRVMPGVAALSQGAWYRPDADGTDAAGSINVLTSLRPTPAAHGNAQHTNLVEVIRAEG